MQPWKVLDHVDTPEGPLELRQRGPRDFLITIAGRVLMTSVAHRSEDDLAQLTCTALAGVKRPRVLIGGLGMGYTLRAALDGLPTATALTVVDLNSQVVGWCRGPLAVLTNNAIGDKRVKVQIADVARVIAATPPGHFDAIVLDLYEGPHQATNRARDPLYGREALERTWNAVRPGGTVAIWSEEADASFESRFAAAGFTIERHRGRSGGRAHLIYLGTRSKKTNKTAKGG